MHQKGVVHADIKTLNVVRIDDTWKRIDLDAACRVGEDFVGLKSGSAYIAPEVIHANKDSKTVFVE